MPCPYCLSDITDAAVVCATCQRDLFLLKPLQQRLAELEKKLQDAGPERNAGLDARIAELEDRLFQRDIIAPMPANLLVSAKRGKSGLTGLISALSRLFIQCPYCTAIIKSTAQVCPKCQRDLFLIKPLQRNLADIKEKLQDSSAERQAKLEAHITELEGRLRQQESGAPDSIAGRKSVKKNRYFLSALLAAVISLILLLAAHGLIVILFDLKPLYLRIASLLIPLPFGFALYVWYPRRFWHSTIMALLVACSAVLGMSAVTGYVDKVPVMPENLREWREFAEYAASITFSFVTGLFLGKLRYNKTRKTARPNRVAVYVAKLIAKDDYGESGTQKLVANITGISTVAAPAVSGVVAVYSGIKAVIGG